MWLPVCSLLQTHAQAQQTSIQVDFSGPSNSGLVGQTQQTTNLFGRLTHMLNEQSSDAVERESCRAMLSTLSLLVVTFLQSLYSMSLFLYDVWHSSDLPNTITTVTTTCSTPWQTYFVLGKLDFGLGNPILDWQPDLGLATQSWTWQPNLGLKSL